MKKKVEIQVETPTIPNFLRNIVKGREKAYLIPISDFTEAELREVGAEFTEKLVKQAAKRRKSNNRQ